VHQLFDVDHGETPAASPLKPSCLQLVSLAGESKNVGHSVVWPAMASEKTDAGHNLTRYSSRCFNNITAHFTPSLL
jgi:hypothetical protein